MALFLFDRGPWSMTNGNPFGQALSKLLSPSFEVISPPRYDEFGNLVPPSPLLTGTTAEGVRSSAGTCNNWTTVSASFSTRFGSTEATGAEWTDQFDIFCNATTQFRLVCMQNSIFPPALPAFGTSGRIVFVTSDAFDANLGTHPDAAGKTGIEAGDAICKAAASAATLDHAASFKAWLSSSSMSAKDRFDFDGPWVRIDGLQVAASLDELTSGALRVPINVEPSGSYRGGGRVWTGTHPEGTVHSQRCSEWTSDSNAQTAGFGHSARANSFWSGSTEQSCAIASSLYCFSDIDVGYLFSDGFESGDVMIWSGQYP